MRASEQAIACVAAWAAIFYLSSRQAISSRFHPSVSSPRPRVFSPDEPGAIFLSLFRQLISSVDNISCSVKNWEKRRIVPAIQEDRCSARGQTAFRIDIFCAMNSTNPRSIASMRLNRRQIWASRRASLPLPNKEIAQRLGITEHTVSNYLFCMYNKLGISTRVELVLHIVKQREEHGAAG